MAIAYIPLVLPAEAEAATRRIAFEHAAGGTVYRRADGSHVLAREAWPYAPDPAPSPTLHADTLPFGTRAATQPPRSDDPTR